MNRAYLQITNVEILANSNPTVLVKVDFKVMNKKSFQLNFKHTIPDYNKSYDKLKNIVTKMGSSLMNCLKQYWKNRTRNGYGLITSSL